MQSRMKWKQCKKVFDFDGSWRDIYVLNADRDDWNKLLESLPNSAYEIMFWIDGKVAEPIKTIQEALEIRNHASPLMRINASGLHIACYFFTDEEIEFDIDPREVNNQQDLDKVISFMFFSGDLLQKKVILTPENISSLVMIEFNPKTQSMISYDVEYP